MTLTFIETKVFTRRLLRMELEDDLRWIQASLEENPVRGSLEAGTGGVRKMRVAHGLRGMGKRGGARVLYLYLPEFDVIYLLLVYGKNEMDALSHGQLAELRTLTTELRRARKESQDSRATD